MNAGKPVCATARTDLNVRTVGNEVVVHDPVTQRTHALDPVTAVVLSHCDGTTTLEQLAVAAGAEVTAGQVQAALDQLEANGLVTVTAPGDVSRRRVITRVAAAGAAGVAIPVVQSVVAPGVAAAQTGGNGNGNGNGNGGTPALDTATATTTGVLTVSGNTGALGVANRPSIYNSVVYDLDFAVTSSNTSVVSGATSVTATGGPFDVDNLPNLVLAGTSQINWNDSSTSQASFELSIELGNPPGQQLVLTMSITSGRFAGVSVNSYPQVILGTVPNPGDPPADPIIVNLTFGQQLVLGG